MYAVYDRKPSTRIRTSCGCIMSPILAVALYLVVTLLIVYLF
jgi:hypothetical protein